MNILEKSLGVLSKVASAIASIAIIAAAGFTGLAMWNAAHADAVVIENFAVPPTLAEKGNSGEVLADRMVDKISMMQALNQSHTRSAVRDHGGEVYHFLRAWLGHESHVSGAVTQEAAGLVVTIRIDGRNVASYAGSEGELDALVLKAAQHVVDVAQNHKPVPV